MMWEEWWEESWKKWRGSNVKALGYHSSWSLDFVPQEIRSPQRPQEIRDVIISNLVVSDFAISVEADWEGVRDTR